MPDERTLRRAQCHRDGRTSWRARWAGRVRQRGVAIATPRRFCRAA